MERRNFIKLGLFSLGTWALSESLDLLSKDPGHIGKAIGLGASLKYLSELPPFQEIEKILSPYGSFELILSETKNFSDAQLKRSNSFHFLKLNSSYGRWANFTLDNLFESISSDRHKLSGLFIETQGAAGAALLESSGLQVVSKVSQFMHNHYLIRDACPHFYNALIAEGRSYPSQKTYFIDSSTRPSLILLLVPARALRVSEEHRKSIEGLLAKLQTIMDNYETNSLLQISSLVPTVDFGKILDLPRLTSKKALT